MKRLALVVGVSVIGVGALVGSSGAASQPAPGAASQPASGAASQPAPSLCGGQPVNVVVDSTGVLLGTPGDDFVVVDEGIPFYGGGGTDTICNAEGKTMAIALNDDEGPIEPAPAPTSSRQLN